MQKTSSGSAKIFYPKLTKDEVIRVISERLKELSEILPLAKVVLFGSYAKGNYTVGSDIDLLMVYDGEKKVDDYILVTKILDLRRLEPHIYTVEEYKQMEKYYPANDKRRNRIIDCLIQE